MEADIPDLALDVPLAILAGALLFVFLLVRWSRPRKTAYYGQTMGETKPESPSPAEVSGKPPMSRGKRLGLIAFLSFWLSIWSLGVYAALTTRIAMRAGEEGFIFLTIWLAVAIPGWFFVAWTILRLVRGDEIDIEFDGDAGGDGGD